MKYWTLETVEYDDLKQTYKDDFDSYDPWGSTVNWLFMLNDYLLKVRGETSAQVRCEYSPGASRDCDIEDDATLELFDNAKTEDLERFCFVLARYDEKLRLNGRNY